MGRISWTVQISVHLALDAINQYCIHVQYWLSYFPMQTLGDLARAFKLYAVCDPCARTVALDLQRLMQEQGDQCSLQQIKARVRCRQCGRRTADIRIVYVGPCGRAGGFHYNR